MKKAVFSLVYFLSLVTVFSFKYPFVSKLEMIIVHKFIHCQSAVYHNKTFIVDCLVRFLMFNNADRTVG